LGWLLGLVIILNLVTKHPTSNDMEDLGKSLAVSLIPVIHGIFLGILSRILRTRIEMSTA
jgi:hypothetical protein